MRFIAIAALLSGFVAALPDISPRESIVELVSFQNVQYTVRSSLMTDSDIHRKAEIIASVSAHFSTSIHTMRHLSVIIYGTLSD